MQTNEIINYLLKNSHVINIIHLAETSELDSKNVLKKC